MGKAPSRNNLSTELAPAFTQPEHAATGNENDELERHKRQTSNFRKTVLLLLLFISILLWLILQRWPTKIVFNQLGARPNLTVSDGSISQEAITDGAITYDKIDPTVWEQVKASLAVPAATYNTVQATNNVTNTTSTTAVTNNTINNITDNSTTTTNNIVTNLLDGLYVRPDDQPASGDISGTFDSGLNVDADSVALGTDTTGDYVASLLAGAGLQGDTGSSGSEGLIVDLSIGAGNGITVSADSIALNLLSTGGLVFSGSALSLLNTCSDGQVLKWSASGSSWACGADNTGSGSSSLSIGETDGAPNVTAVTRLEFGPATSSSEEFVVSDQGSGTARVRTGSAIPLTNQSATISGVWTFNSSITANGGLSCTDCIALGSETSGNYLAGLLAGSGLSVAGSGSEGATPTVSLDSSLAMFKTIDTSLGTDPVADSLTDTLSLSSGDGVNVTGNASSDTLTFSLNLASGGGLAVNGGALTLLSTCSDGQIIKWSASGSSWNCSADNTGLTSSPLTVDETDGTPSVTTVTELEFGPTTGSSEEFVITDQGSGTARVRTGTAVPLSNQTATISGAWTFNSSITANGGLSCTDCIALGSETTGNYVAGILSGSGLSITGSGSEGATPTISLDSSLAIFKTIDASLGTDPVADSLTDTLSLTSGNGVNVTGDASGDSVAFSLNLASGGGLAINGSALTLLNTCSDGQYLTWTSGSSSWGCASIAASPNLFQTIAGDTGSAVADSATDTITLVGGNGVTTTGASTPDTVTLDLDLASGSGMTFSSGALSLLACSDGQILRRTSGAWACATESAPDVAYQQHLTGSDNVTIGSSFTPLLTNGSGTAQNLPITIASGNRVAFMATIEVSSSLATGPATFTLIRDDNNDNDCATGGGDGTQIGGQVSSFVASVAQSFTTTFGFIDTSPGTTTPRYQLCASTTIAIGTATATDRSLKLEEIGP